MIPIPLVLKAHLRELRVLAIVVKEKVTEAVQGPILQTRAVQKAMVRLRTPSGRDP